MSDVSQSIEKDDGTIFTKEMMVAASLAVLIFVAGGLAGYFLARSVYGTQQAGGSVKTDGDPQIGPDNAKVTIVEFSDFQCPYCKRFRDETLNVLVEKYGDDIRFVYRDYPLPSHPQAQKAAEAAECADEQGKFWEMHDLLYSNQESLSDDLYTVFAAQLGLDTQKFNDCLSSNKYAEEVAADLQDGQAYGVTGTPTFFVNGQVLVGAQPVSAFEALIDQELGS
jgi:protein-disulfide isomerase